MMKKRCFIILIIGLFFNLSTVAFANGIETGTENKSLVKNQSQSAMQLKKAVASYLENGMFNLSFVLGPTAKNKDIDFAELNMDEIKEYVGQWTVQKNEKSTEDGEFRATKMCGKTKVMFKGIYHSYLAVDKKVVSPDFCGLEISGASEFKGKTKNQLVACFGKGFVYRLEKGDSKFGVLPAITIIGEDPNKRAVFYLDKKGKTNGTIEIKLLADW